MFSRLASLLILLPLLGCGASSQTIQGNTLLGVRVVSDMAVDAIEIVCTPERVMASEDPAPYRGKCLKAIEGHDTSRALWSLWRDAFVLAVVNDDAEALEKAWRFLSPILELYGETQEFLAEFDIHLPDMPVQP